MPLRVNGQRLWQALMDLAKIGATEKGGVRRLALTDLDRQGRDLVCTRLREAGCSITVDRIGSVERVSSYAAMRFDPGCVTAVRDAAAVLGHRHMDIVSGAGHDAVYLARVARTGMIFVPCEGGISHNEVENAKPEDLEAGCNVLLQVILERAGAVVR